MGAAKASSERLSKLPRVDPAISWLNPALHAQWAARERLFRRKILPILKAET